MNHAQIVDLATALAGLRPDWQQPGIVAQLKQLNETWPGTTAAFYVHAVTVAANPQARTPGALTPSHPPNPLFRLGVRHLNRPATSAQGQNPSAKRNTASRSAAGWKRMILRHLRTPKPTPRR